MPYTKVYASLEDIISSGRGEETIESMRRAIENNPHLATKQPGAFAQTHSAMGDMLQQIGREEEAVKAWREAINSEYGLIEHDPPRFVASQQKYLAGLRKLGRLSEATEEAQKALQPENDLLTRHPLAFAVVNAHLGLCLENQQGRENDAVEALLQAANPEYKLIKAYPNLLLEILPKIFLENHQTSENVKDHTKKFEEILKNIYEDKDFRTENPHNFALICIDYANFLYSSLRCEEALEKFREAFKPEYEYKSNIPHEDYNHSLENYASCAYQAKQFTKASEIFAECDYDLLPVEYVAQYGLSLSVKNPAESQKILADECIDELHKDNPSLFSEVQGCREKYGNQLTAISPHSNPASLPDLITLGLNYHNSKKHEKAAQLDERSNASFLRAKKAYDDKNHDESEQNLKHIFDLNDKQLTRYSDAKLMQCEIFIQKENFEDARIALDESMEHASRLLDPSMESRILFCHAKIKCHTGNFQDALYSCDELSRMGPSRDSSITDEMIKRLSDDAKERSRNAQPTKNSRNLAIRRRIEASHGKLPPAPIWNNDEGIANPTSARETRSDQSSKNPKSNLTRGTGASTHSQNQTTAETTPFRQESEPQPKYNFGPGTIESTKRADWKIFLLYRPHSDPEGLPTDTPDKLLIAKQHFSDDQRQKIADNGEWPVHPFSVPQSEVYTRQDPWDYPAAENPPMPGTFDINAIGPNANKPTLTFPKNPNPSPAKTHGRSS